MMIGRTLGHYRLVEQIGMGGMATVYKAYDPDADRYVAIKVLPEHFSKDPTFRQRFEREAKAIAKLEHLHILPLFAYGEEDGIAYMVMRYLKAGSLTERIQAGALTLPEASRLLTQIAGALDHAHANGVLHRDVKPSNVLLDTDGNAYLTDFGIAKMTESTLDLTGAGILGTPAYMSPEQCRGSAELTPASDQYSLGIILYEMVTGRAPYQAETPIALIHKQLFDPLPMPRQLRPDLPEEAEQVILKALTKDPQLRYPTCSAMAAAFARSVAQLAAPPVDKDGTLVSTKPSAVTTPAIAAEAAVKSTAPVVDEATALHPLPVPAPETVAPRPKRRIPVWALVVGAVLALGLVVALLVSLRKWRDNTAAESEATATPEYIAAQPTVEQPAAAAPPLAAPAESAVEETPPNLSATPRVARPCNWDNHGGGLCIFLPNQEQPFKIMESFTSFGRPSWSPDGQRLAVSAKESRNQEGDIYLVNLDGSNLKRLANMGNDLDPVWSPDGEWLAFYNNCNLAMMRINGSAPTVLWFSDGSKCAYQPQWSPDSRLLVVGVAPALGDFPTTIEVWVMAVKGGIVTPIAKTTHKNWDCITDWAFSPDSAQVAYMDDDCKAWLVKADGSGQPEALTEFPYDWQGNTYPQWEGKAQTAAPLSGLSAEPRQVRPCDWGGHGSGLCIYTPEEEQPLAKILQEAGFTDFNGLSSWSPDGRRIAFSAQGRGNDADLYLVNTDGSNLTHLPNIGNDVSPAWSPDGEWLAFHSNCNLVKTRVNGTEPVVLWPTDGNKCVTHPQWSPDSERVIMATVTGGGDWTFPLTREIWVVSVKDNRAVSLGAVIFQSAEHDCFTEMAFSPDGAQVAYMDEQCRPWLNKADGSGQPESLPEFPDKWRGATYPQWGGQAAPPARP